MTMNDKDSSEFAVEVDRISFNYGKIKALDELSLKIPAGISFGLLGPNGAGKTTLIRALVGLIKPKSGNIFLKGQKQSRKLSSLIGYMPQLHSLYNELSVMQNIEFFSKIYRNNGKKEQTKRIEEVVRLVDLWERRNDSVLKLSGGMKQRVSLACAIVHQPPLLFLDEPTVGLDPELRHVFWEHFENLNKQGITIIISSHTMDDAGHCDHLAFIRDGKVIAQGTPDSLKEATGETDATLEDAFLHFIHREDASDA